MNLNGISTTNYNTTNTNTTKKSTEEKTTTDNSQSSSTTANNTVTKSAVIYEKSSDNSGTNRNKKNIANPELIQKLKSDADAKTAQFKSLVEKLLTKQGQAVTFNDDIWNKIRTGQVSVDSETAAKAADDVSENGYWGVKQTSERILSFAQGLAGSDPDKLEKMRGAFEKGFKAAEKMWGGELPSISKQTYDSVMKGFDDLQEKYSKTSANA